MASDDGLGRSDPDLRPPCRRDDQHHACWSGEISRPGRSSRASEMGLWSVPMLLAAELLRVRVRVRVRVSLSGMAFSSSGVALAQALLVLALVRDSSPWPCRAQGHFFASLR